MKPPRAVKTQSTPNLTFRRNTKPLENAFARMPDGGVWHRQLYTLTIFVDQRLVGSVHCVQRQLQTRIAAPRSWHIVSDWNINLDIDNRVKEWTIPGRISQAEVLAEVRAWIVDRIEPPHRRLARRPS